MGRWFFSEVPHFDSNGILDSSEKTEFLEKKGVTGGFAPSLTENRGIPIKI
jgi:hypothetical protein